MKRKQADRDAEAGLHEAFMALVEMARREDDCTCRPCRRLEDGAQADLLEGLQSGDRAGARASPKVGAIQVRETA